jgi:hypothetical protein
MRRVNEKIVLIGGAAVVTRRSRRDAPPQAQKKICSGCRDAHLALGKAGLAHKYTKRCAAGLDPAALNLFFVKVPTALRRLPMRCSVFAHAVYMRYAVFVAHAVFVFVHA